MHERKLGRGLLSVEQNGELQDTTALDGKGKVRAVKYGYQVSILILLTEETPVNV